MRFEYEKLRIEKCDSREPCFKCTDERCVSRGKLASDCPKLVCDMGGNCGKCTFIRDFIKSEYGVELDEYIRQ